MADTRRLPAPQAAYWDWQLNAACRGMPSTMFFHPPDERGPARDTRVHNAQTVCRTCPVIDQCLTHALRIPATLSAPYRVFPFPAKMSAAQQIDPYPTGGSRRWVAMHELGA